MWQFQQIDNPSGATLWFSDGQPVTAPRGGDGVSSRLMVDGQGFLDLTDVQIAATFGASVEAIDCNGVDLALPVTPAELTLWLPGDGSFTVALEDGGGGVAGRLKPFPAVSAADAAYLDTMIAGGYVPYPNIPDAPGKTTEQIRALGQQLFPFSPYAFELAMSIYDWTTASFTRMVFMKIFQYTSMPASPLPLDQSSIANEIWESDWGTYTPQNPDYMKSFLMKPATSLQDVQVQLASVATQLQQFGDVENRLLAAAFQSMPRTSTFDQPQLFSGQMDIYQLGTEHFGIEFLQCPLNAGPTSVPLQIDLQLALDTYIGVGDTLTTKMVWSFGNSMDEAMQYQNGIVLVANPPTGAAVWDVASYITPLSDDPTKIEYTFAPGTTFLVQSVEQTQVDSKTVWVINLLVQPAVALHRSPGVVDVAQEASAG
ncbi:hypothetical protein [Montanilutibacter psychrotolerans]|uniref:Uncharacterized protein n=1 Tax=Montanilutibacter psychrotolerans TaxID=1327343 RepID=A0A3M8SS69_9GAMM|nr:hypothetical protein [Lysobacter psychrotolerans]RNF82054.1 hypothetical protein EER27_15510 [Lysobacter psychrotolerans]